VQTLLFLLTAVAGDAALARPDVEFKVFQFPADRIPRIDGNPDDWSLVPDSCAIGMDPLREMERTGIVHLTRQVEGPEGQPRRTKVWDVTLP